MQTSAIDNLLREQQSVVLQERRVSNRQPFVRPVTIQRQRAPAIRAFSRDISPQGISLILDEDLQVGSVYELEIHSIGTGHHQIRAELRWCNRFGQGWYATGWFFL